MNFAPNRVVAIATPLVFAPLAGAITAWVAKHAPGVEVNEGQLQAIFIAGATIAVAKAALWTKGWQDHEKRQEILPPDALEPANSASALGFDAEPDIDAAGDDAAIGDDADTAALDADIDDDEADESHNDLLAELEAAMAEAEAEAAGAVPAGKA